MTSQFNSAYSARCVRTAGKSMTYIHALAEASYDRRCF